MLKVEIPKDKAKIEQQIKALESLTATDSKKDNQIHLQAIKTLREALFNLYGIKILSNGGGNNEL